MTIFLPILCLLGSARFQDRVAVKQVLPNGATLLTQRVPGSNRFSIALAAVSIGASEKKESHGVRHLLEHLVAKGPNHELDNLLESRGMVLKAETTRDAIVFEVSGPATELPVAIEAVKHILSGFKTTPAEVSKEVRVLREESLLRPWGLLLVSDAWLKASSETALDPFGTLDTIEKLDVPTLEAAYRETFSASSLCCSLVGEINAEQAAAAVTDVLKPLVDNKPTEPAFPIVFQKNVSVGSLDGEGVSIPVGNLLERSTGAALAAGFGLRAWVQGCQVVYTPSPRNGLVTVLLPTGTGWTQVRERLRGRDQAVSQTGLRLLQSWQSGLRTDLAQRAVTSATILPLRPSFDFDDFCDSLLKVNRSDIDPVVRAVLNPGENQ